MAKEDMNQCFQGTELSRKEMTQVSGGYCPPRATTLPGPSGYHGASGDNPGIPDMTNSDYRTKKFTECTGDDFDIFNPNCPDSP